MAAIELTNVRKSFGETVLDGVDLTVERGEIVVLMGPNGAGKSVLTSCISGATAPSDGSVELFDGTPPSEAGDRIGLLLQEPMADRGLTGREYLRFREGIHPRGTADWADLAERLELAEDLDRLIRSYSGGMTRLVDLLAALAADVPLFLLDEPATALDLSRLRVLHDELLARRTEDRAILMTSHTPLDAQIADRIAFLRSGRVVADGRPDELLTDLPPVLRVRGIVPDPDPFLGERTFRRGDEIRGFVDRDAADALEDELASAGAIVERDEPTYTDLFNYHAHLHGEEGT